MTYEKDESDSREETAFQLEINEGDEAAGTSEQSADARRDPSDHHTTMTAPNRQKQHKSIPPFLPFSCPVPPSAPAIYPPIPARRKSRWEEPVPGSDAILLAPLVARSVHFRGTGSEVKRVLRRAVKSSLYGVQRKREGDIGSEGGALEDERGFRILVLGGSGSFDLLPLRDMALMCCAQFRTAERWILRAAGIRIFSAGFTNHFPSSTIPLLPLPPRRTTPSEPNDYLPTTITAPFGNRARTQRRADHRREDES